MESHSNTVTAVAKIAGCTAVITGIAFAFVVLGPEGAVERVGADIFWGGGIEDNTHEQFLEVLQQEGFSDPQPYDYNGNIMYFAQGETTEAPRDAARRLQEALVREGVNDQVYPVPARPDVADGVLMEQVSDPDEIDEREVAYSTIAGMEYFSGGLIPIIDTGDKVAMSGVDVTVSDELQNEYDLNDFPALMAELQARSGTDATEIIDNIRYIEVFRPERSATTQKVAIFGDGDIDLSNFAPGAGSAPPGGEVIPPCPDCRRNTSFAGLQDQSDYQMQTYNSPSAPGTVMAFYERTLAERGWQMSTGAALAQQIRGTTAPAGAADNLGETNTFVRDGHTVQIQVYNAGGETHVNVFHGQ